MFQANAEMPEKYRETVNPVDATPVKELLDRMRDKGVPRMVEGKARRIG